MLPKNQRLNLKKDFKWVASGKRLETPLFKLFYRTGDNLTALVGVATSKTHFKGAVERNLAKRLSFQAAGSIYPILPRSLNLVIMPKAEILKKSLVEITESLKDVALGNFSN